jgi:hypothetical protein
MAYKPNPNGPVRDKAYPSEIAAQRPLLAPRIHCEESPEEMDPETSVRGDVRDGRSAEFNRRLRSGE